MDYDSQCHNYKTFYMEFEEEDRHFHVLLIIMHVIIEL